MCSRTTALWCNLAVVNVLVSFTIAQARPPAKLESAGVLTIAIGVPSQTIPQSARKHNHNKYEFSGIGRRNIARGTNLYSWEAEKELGEKLARIVEQQSDLIVDPVITEYVDRLEQRIAHNSDYRGPLTVKIVKDVDTNAYSLPGGLIYVQTGIILAAENEAELAAVLAHETGHLAARHMTRLITRQKTWKVLSLAFGGPAGYLFVKKALPIFLMKSMRNSEFEADLLGLEYQYAAGYDPDEFLRLLKVVDEGVEKASLLTRLTDSHPLTDARIRHAQSDIARYLPTRTQHIIDTSEFQEMKRRVSNLMGISDSDWKSADDSSFTGDSFQPLATQP